jgi:hypothetical protein
MNQNATNGTTGTKTAISKVKRQGLSGRNLPSSMIDASTNIAVSSRVPDFYVEHSGTQAEERTAEIENAIVLCALWTKHEFRATDEAMASTASPSENKFAASSEPTFPESVQCLCGNMPSDFIGRMLCRL